MNTIYVSELNLTRTQVVGILYSQKYGRKILINKCSMLITEGTLAKKRVIITLDQSVSEIGTE